MEKRGYGGRPQRGGATDRGARPSLGDDVEDALGPPGEAGEAGTGGNQAAAAVGARRRRRERKASNMHDNNINNT